MKRIVVIVIAVILTLTALLPGVTFADDSETKLEPMRYYAGGHCGPSSGVSIGWYYKTRDRDGDGLLDYPNLPSSKSRMWDRLHDYMDTQVTGYTEGFAYGPGFVEMALHYGYDNFSYDYYEDVNTDDYQNIVKNAIDNGWPVALASMGILVGFSGVDALQGSGVQEHSCCPWPCTVWHWIAIKGYWDDYWDGSMWHECVVICTDSYSGCNYLLLDWDQLIEQVGEFLEMVVIKDDDPEDGYVEDFEWGSDGMNLEEYWQDYGGEVDWEVSADGASVVEIDTEFTHEDSQGSARFYRDGSNNVYAYYSLLEPSYIGFYLRKSDTAIADFRNGNGNKCIWVKVNDEEEVQYANSGGYLQTLDYDEFPVDDWVYIEFRNINWAGTYDIYINGSREAQGATMVNGSYYQENLYFGSYWDGLGSFWIDDIIDLIPEPEATTLELLPETDSNSVGTIHKLTATVYDQIGCEMEGVDVTWSISGVGLLSGTEEDITDAGGEADAWILSSVPGTSTVTCTVTDTGISDTATNDWTYVIEDFEWGSDGDSLQDSGGELNWAVTSQGGSSFAEIDEDKHYAGTRSAKIYRDGSNNVHASYSLFHPSEIGFYMMKEDGAAVWLYHGDGAYRIKVRLQTYEKLQYYDTEWHTVASGISNGAWHLLELKDIDWGNGTFDIWFNGNREANDVSMESSTKQNGEIMYACGSTGSIWIDNIF